jgi:hypothetical protein
MVPGTVSATSTEGSSMTQSKGIKIVDPADDSLDFEDLKAVPGDPTDIMFSDNPSPEVPVADDKWTRAVMQRTQATGPARVSVEQKVPDILRALVEASHENHVANGRPMPEDLPFDTVEDAAEFMKIVRWYAANRPSGKISVRVHTLKDNPTKVRFSAKPYAGRAPKTPA